jgi:hypothetical protein
VGQNRDVTVELQVSDGNGRSDTDTTTVIIEPSQAGSIQVTPNVQSAGNSGKYSFELENTGSVDATIVALGINNTTDAQATKVGGNADDPIFEETSPQSRQLISTVIQFDSNTQTAARYNFDQNVDLARGQARTFEFDRFRDSSEGNGKMKNDTVYITLWFSDGSTATIELAP